VCNYRIDLPWVLGSISSNLMGYLSDVIEVVEDASIISIAEPPILLPVDEVAVTVKPNIWQRILDGVIWRIANVARVFYPALGVVFGRKSGRNSGFPRGPAFTPVALLV
jgi:hypothetical protein